MPDWNHQGEQTADDGSDQKSQAHGDNPRKDRRCQIGADTLRGGVRDGVCERVHVANALSLLRAAVIL